MTGNHLWPLTHLHGHKGLLGRSRQAMANALRIGQPGAHRPDMGRPRAKRALEPLEFIPSASCAWEARPLEFPHPLSAPIPSKGALTRGALRYFCVRLRALPAA
jgi:hypothetical protein